VLKEYYAKKLGALIDSLVADGGVELNRIFPAIDDENVNAESAMHEFTVEFEVPLSRSLMAKSF
jgi:hypothetical protein